MKVSRNNMNNTTHFEYFLEETIRYKNLVSEVTEDLESLKGGSKSITEFVG